MKTLEELFKKETGRMAKEQNYDMYAEVPITYRYSDNYIEWLEEKLQKQHKNCYTCKYGNNEGAACGTCDDDFSGWTKRN